MVFGCMLVLSDANLRLANHASVQHLSSRTCHISNPKMCLGSCSQPDCGFKFRANKNQHSILGDLSQIEFQKVANSTSMWRNTSTLHLHLSWSCGGFVHAVLNNHTWFHPCHGEWLWGSLLKFLRKTRWNGGNAILQQRPPDSRINILIEISSCLLSCRTIRAFAMIFV